MIVIIIVAIIHIILHIIISAIKVMKALKMSVIHVVAFIVSWTPYTVMGTW